MENQNTIDMKVLAQLVAKNLAFETKQVLNVDEASKFLGFTKNTLYRLLSDKAIPHYKPRNKTIFFKRDELEKWALRGRVKTFEEIEQEAKDYCTTHKTTKK